MKLIGLGLSIILFLTGCTGLLFSPGGGGSFHTPPSEVPSGQPVELTLELSSWGSGSPKLENRYTQIICHYRRAEDTRFQQLAAQPIHSEDNKLIVQVTLPASATRDTKALTYYFDFLFDGVYNITDEETVPVQH